MKYDKLYPNMHHLQVINGMMYCNDTKPCEVCKEPTHYVDICYETHICSTECMNEFEKDLINGKINDNFG